MFKLMGKKIITIIHIFLLLLNWPYEGVLERDFTVSIDFSLTVKAATLIVMSGHGSVISSA